MALAVQEDVLGFAVAVDNALLVKVTQAKDDLTGVEPAPFLGEARLASHVVDVELQVSAFHDGQNCNIILH